MENKKKKGLAPPRYDEAFKNGAIRMVTEQGRLTSEVAQELGICVDTLRTWLKNAGVQAGQANRLNREQKKFGNWKMKSKISKNIFLKKTRSLTA